MKATETLAHPSSPGFLREHLAALVSLLVVVALAALDTPSSVMGLLPRLELRLGVLVINAVALGYVLAVASGGLALPARRAGGVRAGLVRSLLRLLPLALFCAWHLLVSTWISRWLWFYMVVGQMGSSQ